MRNDVFVQRGLQLFIVASFGKISHDLRLRCFFFFFCIGSYRNVGELKSSEPDHAPAICQG